VRPRVSLNAATGPARWGRPSRPSTCDWLHHGRNRVEQGAAIRTHLHRRDQIPSRCFSSTSRCVRQRGIFVRSAAMEPSHVLARDGRPQRSGARGVVETDSWSRTTDRRRDCRRNDRDRRVRPAAAQGACGVKGSCRPQRWWSRFIGRSRGVDRRRPSRRPITMRFVGRRERHRLLLGR